MPLALQSKSNIIEVKSLNRTSQTGKVRNVQRLLASSNLGGVQCREVSALYRLEGGCSDADVQKISEDLLCDTVTETYAVNAKPSDPQSFFADVWYKPGVTDAVGESVVNAIVDLNLTCIQRAFSGTRYEFHASQANAGDSILKFVNSQLLNPLIQECRIAKV